LGKSFRVQILTTEFKVNNIARQIKVPARQMMEQGKYRLALK